jgi:hypothetical protein
VLQRIIDTSTSAKKGHELGFQGFLYIGNVFKPDLDLPKRTTIAVITSAHPLL